MVWIKPPSAIEAAAVINVLGYCRRSLSRAMLEFTHASVVRATAIRVSIEGGMGRLAAIRWLPDEAVDVRVWPTCYQVCSSHSTGTDVRSRPEADSLPDGGAR